MKNNDVNVPVWEKIVLTIPEASALFSIGVNELRKKANDPGCSFVLCKGTHKLIKRKKLEEYIDSINTW